MSMDIILIGAGGHCRSCIDVIEQEARFSIAGIVEKSYSKGFGSSVLGYPIIGTDEDLSELRKKYQYALVTVGQIKSPDVRIRLYDMLLELGFEMPSIISPLAYVSKHASIGRGTIVMHQALVNAAASIGNNCIINTKALVEHDAVIEEHCHISTGAVVNGEVCIGSGSFIGSGCVIKERVKLAGGCLAGMGLSIRKNQPKGARIIS